MNIQFRKDANDQELKELRAQHYAQLSAPPDGMWESFAESASQWIIEEEKDALGYFSVDAEGVLLKCFILSEYLTQGKEILSTFIEQEHIDKAMVGTNDPTFLSLSISLQQSVRSHTYLFSSYQQVEVAKQEGTIHTAKQADKERLVDFCHASMGAPKIWLSAYLGSLINDNELFFLERNDDALGTFEVRASDLFPKTADLGIIVAPAHRRKGLGTYLLSLAKKEALRNKKTPICSCEVDNIGSLRAIHNNGFRSVHQMLMVQF